MSQSESWKRNYFTHQQRITVEDDIEGKRRRGGESLALSMTSHSCLLIRSFVILLYISGVNLLKSCSRTSK